MKSLLTRSLRQARRVVVAVIGSTVLLAGAAMIILPGPAVVVVPVGLAILATEFVWARRLLRKAREWLRNGTTEQVKRGGHETVKPGTEGKTMNSESP
ncbi:MAG TPA: PGPGW domain-containing protein [Nitrospirota bacterium]|nr:PGPGW domain-containing protein [Nitrospirota bacterium]